MGEKSIRFFFIGYTVHYNTKGLSAEHLKHDLNHGVGISQTRKFPVDDYNIL